jgi:tetratricopeptide (TPR) repeat protein
MKKNKYIMVDLILLGLTIALMTLLEVVFYPSNPNDPSVNAESVSVKGNKDFSVLSNNKDQSFELNSGKHSNVTDQIFKEAVLYKNTGELDAALSSCNKAITIDSAEARGYFLRAQINTQLDRNLEAIKDYTMTLKFNPNLFQAYLNRGLLCMKQKERLKAFFDFFNAFRISPLKSTSFLLLHAINNIF